MVRTRAAVTVAWRSVWFAMSADVNMFTAGLVTSLTTMDASLAASVDIGAAPSVAANGPLFGYKRLQNIHSSSKGSG
jgi:hypothetical protein